MGGWGGHAGMIDGRGVGRPMNVFDWGIGWVYGDAGGTIFGSYNLQKLLDGPPQLMLGPEGFVDRRVAVPLVGWIREGLGPRKRRCLLPVFISLAAGQIVRVGLSQHA